jgi:hypothetical protein
MTTTAHLFAMHTFLQDTIDNGTRLRFLDLLYYPPLREKLVLKLYLIIGINGGKSNLPTRLRISSVSRAFR